MRQKRTVAAQLLWDWLVRILLLVVIGGLVLGALVFTGILKSPWNAPTSIPWPPPISASTSTTVPSTALALSTPSWVNSTDLGLSDGKYAFDTDHDRSNGDLKKQAAKALNYGDLTTAQSLWSRAHDVDSRDAEVLIYKEDQRILATRQPYITIVVATMLTGENSAAIKASRDVLRGAYILQSKYNGGFLLGGNLQIRILVANSGSKPEDAKIVAQQIVRAAQQDTTIIGVMGWPYSGQTLQAVDTLANAHIPMVSGTASSDALTKKSPFFFRVCPPNEVQAVIGADYAVQRLNAKRVVLFVDPDNTYTQSLADSFSTQLTKNGGQIIKTEPYTVGDHSGLPALLQDALASNPDLIYFSGYADDMGVILTNLQSSNPNLNIMGGDALYHVPYPPSAHVNYHRLRFTTFAFPDEWKVLGYPQPSFFGAYADTYDPHKDHPGDYEYGRPNSDVILGYDAMFSLAEASKNALTDRKTPLTPDALQQSLQALTGNKSIQGISGQIAFGTDGNPIDKAVVILSVDASGYTQLEKKDVLGCFLKNQCS